MYRFFRFALVVLIFTLTYTTWVAAETTPDFCDTTRSHGSSKSCKAVAQAKGLLVCTNGATVKNINCNPGQACTENGQLGSWCTCTFDC